MSNPFRYFNSSPEIIRLAVLMYVKYPLSLRNVEDLLAERGIDISHETVRFWWNRFGPMFAAEIRKRRVAHMRGYPQWRWHLDEAFVKVNGKLCPQFHIEIRLSLFSNGPGRALLARSAISAPSPAPAQSRRRRPEPTSEFQEREEFHDTRNSQGAYAR